MCGNLVRDNLDENDINDSRQDINIVFIFKNHISHTMPCWRSNANYLNIFKYLYFNNVYI